MSADQQLLRNHDGASHNSIEVEEISFKSRDKSYSVYVDNIPYFLSLDNLRTIAQEYGLVRHAAQFQPLRQPPCCCWSAIITLYSSWDAVQVAYELHATRPWAKLTLDSNIVCPTEQDGNIPSDAPMGPGDLKYRTCETDHSFQSLRVKIGKKEEKVDDFSLQYHDAVNVLNTFFPLQWSNTITSSHVSAKCMKKRILGNSALASKEMVPTGRNSIDESTMPKQKMLPGGVLGIWNSAEGTYLPRIATIRTQGQSIRPAHPLTSHTMVYNPYLDTSLCTDSSINSNGEHSTSSAGATTTNAICTSADRGNASTILCLDQANSSDTLELEELDFRKQRLHSLNNAIEKSLSTSRCSRTKATLEQNYNIAARCMRHPTTHAALRPTPVPHIFLTTPSALAHESARTSDRLLPRKRPLRPLSSDNRMSSTCPCVYMRQRIEIKNSDGSVAIVEASGGCACRYRGDRQKQTRTQAYMREERESLDEKGQSTNDGATGDKLEHNADDGESRHCGDSDVDASSDNGIERKEVLEEQDRIVISNESVNENAQVMVDRICGPSFYSRNCKATVLSKKELNNKPNHSASKLVSIRQAPAATNHAAVPCDSLNTTMRWSKQSVEDCLKGDNSIINLDSSTNAVSAEQATVDPEEVVFPLSQILTQINSPTKKSRSSPSSVPNSASNTTIGNVASTSETKLKKKKTYLKRQKWTLGGVLMHGTPMKLVAAESFQRAIDKLKILMPKTPSVAKHR